MASVHENFGIKVQLYRRRNSPYWWCSTTVGGGRHRQSTEQEDYDAAKAVAEDWALKLKGIDRFGGGLKKKAIRPFSAAAAQFIDEIEVLTRGERSPEHVVMHRARLKNHLLPFFGDKEVTEITSGDIYNYRIHRLRTGPLRRGRPSRDAKPEAATAPAKRLARSTLHQEMVCLRQVLKAELRKGHLKGLPDMTAPHKASGKTEHRAWFSQAEYKALFTETRRRTESPPRERFRPGYEDLHDVVLFLANTGLRPDELIRLEVRDVTIGIDDETDERILTIEVRGKVGFGPCKSMPGAVEPFRRLVRRRARDHGKDPGKAAFKDVLKSVPASTRLVRKLPRDLLNSVLHALDLKEDREGRPRTFYSLRHTYICLRLLDGAHAYELAKNCRTSVEMIEQYYAVHLKNYINASLINMRKSKSTANSAEDE